MKRFINKKLLITILSIVVFMLVIPTVVKAEGLKVEPTGTANSLKTTPDTLFTLIRQMQSPKGTLGVSSADGNKINCHMAKNTEWGATAILSASKYGNAPSGKSDASTTQNNTGIFQMADETGEYVAGVYEEKALTDVADKYKNVYNNSDKKGYTGDGVRDAWGWKEAGYAQYVTADSPWFLRDYGSLFSYSRQGAWGNYSARAVVVCGQGI